MRARQLKRRKEDLKKIRLYLQRVRESNKKYFDENYRLRTKDFSTSDLVLLYNTKLNKDLFSKLAFK
jgi:chromosome condensin MukBEF complex kleisin-like MukF subunit